MSSSESVRSSSTTASAYSLARSRNSNQAARVFDIPELLKMIASFLRSGDAFHLALSSRAGFHAAVVQLWKSLRGTRRLFALLSGSSVAKSGADGIVIALPDLSTCDFSRFNYYAALVRKIHWHPLRNEIISDWRSFIPYAYNRSLLPNLQHIELPPNLPFHTSLWCPTLCSSSLLAITTGHAPRQSSAGWDDASTVFGTLELRSPGLRALCLFRISKFTDEPTLLIRPQNLELYERIACMKNLRLLSVSTTIFEAAALQLVGTLPRLDTLEIHGLSPLPFPVLPIILPNSSFPKLRTLNISSLKIEEFKSIWGIDSLVAQLATVRLVICEHSDNVDTDSLLRQICASSPNITELSLRFLKQYSDELSTNIFLSLQQISIHDLATFGLYLPRPKITCSVFAVACPLLKRLQIETCSVSVFDLQYFAQLSELQQLSIGVDWESCIELDGMSLRPTYVSESLRRLEWTNDPGVVTSLPLYGGPVATSLHMGAPLGYLTHSNRLFFIPELLRLISKHLSPSDAFGFAQCSRMCFHAAVGEIWYSVVGARRLFDLLPGVSYVPENSTTNIILPDLSTSDFSRFDFYAPLVRRLEIFDEVHDQDVIFDCGSLMSYTQHTTLLPNLKYLVFNSESSEEQLSWLTVFLSPSLLSIQDTIPWYEPVLDAESALALVANIALRCLSLEDLSLYASFDYSPDQHARLIPLLLPIYEYIGRMQNLQSLRTNVPVFEASALPVLGRLTRLDTLEIYQVYGPIFPMEGVTLPDNLFPSLRKLCLPVLEIEEFKAIWNIRQMIDRPVVLEIEFDELEFENDPDMLLNEICQYSPQVVDLKIVFCSTAHVFSTFFRPSKQLSLEKLSISGVDFHHVDIIYKTLSSACTGLCELRLPDHRISILDLRYFSHLARLEHLSIFVVWDSCRELNESVPKPLRVSAAFQTLEASRGSWNPLEPELSQKTVIFALLLAQIEFDLYAWGIRRYKLSTSFNESTSAIHKGFRGMPMYHLPKEHPGSGSQCSFSPFDHGLTFTENASF
ncbi:hypothetical protein BDV93DRAFT_611166 [Ceratobasidium sp. AG-I]|nr:hypothetical protein BDV93DRAFT_611166 [Ceratobasidium sp. AG-I]